MKPAANRVGKFDDGMPLTREEALACEHPDLQSEYGMDGF